MIGWIQAIENFELASPLYFWMGSLLILVLIFLPLFRKKKGLSFPIGFFKRKLKERRSELGSPKIRLIPILIVISSLLIALALAHPQSLQKRAVPFYGQKPIMMVFDASGSMKEKYDKDISKFEKMREALYDFIEKDLGANIGILIYSDGNYIARDFAPKLEFLRDTLENEHEIAKIAGGTNTPWALWTARNFFQKVNIKNKSIVLFSDLEDRLDWIALEIKRCLKDGIKSYVIVVQKEEKGAYRMIDELKTFLGGERGVKMIWIEDKEGISQIYQEIKARKSAFTGEIEVLSQKSLLPFLIQIILGLILILVVLSETIFRKIP